MARFLVRSLVSTIITMFLVSFALFFLLEAGGGDVTVKILGVFATPEQRESLRKQLGLDQSGLRRYTDWLVGNDWRVEDLVGYPLVTIPHPQNEQAEWWADSGDGRYVRWEISDENELVALVRQEDGSKLAEPTHDSVWQTDAETGEVFFWGLDNDSRVVKWVRGSEETAFVSTQTGWQELSGAPTQYIPLRKGILRGDAGISLQTQRPVSNVLPGRVRNTLVLAGTAFVIVMPLALLLGILSGINEGKGIDRFIAITSLTLTATPEFVTGVFLILILGIWLKVFPAVSVFLSDDAIFKDPTLIALPVLTLTAVELGYVIRMTRASMVEVMNTPYIRTAIIKGMPYRRVVFRHAVRNALMAPITIIMLHVNYLVGGIVVVEVIFGFPGLGQYIYDASIFGDVNAIEAAAMITVTIAIATRLLGDLAYTFLNPRIRYA